MRRSRRRRWSRSCRPRSSPRRLQRSRITAACTWASRCRGPRRRSSSSATTSASSLSPRCTRLHPYTAAAATRASPPDSDRRRVRGRGGLVGRRSLAERPCLERAGRQRERIGADVRHRRRGRGLPDRAPVGVDDVELGPQPRHRRGRARHRRAQLGHRRRRRGATASRPVRRRSPLRAAASARADRSAASNAPAAAASSPRCASTEPSANRASRRERSSWRPLRPARSPRRVRCRPRPSPAQPRAPAESVVAARPGGGTASRVPARRRSRRGGRRARRRRHPARRSRGTARSPSSGRRRRVPSPHGGASLPGRSGRSRSRWKSAAAGAIRKTPPWSTISGSPAMIDPSSSSSVGTPSTPSSSVVK